MSKGYIGVYGGTFDPIHFGHLTAAKDVQQKLGLDEIRMVVSARPPHRIEPIVAAEERFNLLSLAVKDEPVLTADDCEINRAGPSYMVDTLRYYRQQMPSCSLVLILGIEAFNAFKSWHRWEEIIDLAHIVVTNREGFGNELDENICGYVNQFITSDKAQLKQCTHGKIYRQPVTAIDISATDIRRRIKSKQSIEKLMPDSCCEYIRRLGFYT